MLVFVTVGSTKFDALVQAAVSGPVLAALHAKGFGRVVLQRGDSELDLGSGSLAITKAGVDIETWTFKPSIEDDIRRADLVVSHAGSGSILDVLRSGKPLIVVPNPTLMDDHQRELALELDRLGHLRSTSVDDLPATIASFDANTLVPFPAFEGEKFLSVVGDVQAYEDEHVHAIYDQIASHFSSTRYKPWPVIAKFISDLPTGWIGLDSGTGNGKYLPLPTDRPSSVLTVGLDRSKNLLSIARNAGSALREVVWGDVLDNGWRTGAFDYAISIATIHHLSSHDRRKLAVQRLFQCVSPVHGRILIYVWAIEQDELSKRFISADDDPPAASSGKDVFVPWVMSHSTASNQATQHKTVPKAFIYNRYYHMFAKGELARLTCEAAQEIGLFVGPPNEGKSGVEIIQDGWERSNYYVELRRWIA